MAPRGRSSLRAGTLLGALLLGMAPGWVGVAGAQAQNQSRPPIDPSGATTGARRESPAAERQRLRRALEQVQADIDQLKKSDRGLRADYRLRARMADAEALARRLTEMDAQEKTRPSIDPNFNANANANANANVNVNAAAAAAEPGAAPTDGPAELEAKADILADQSHRVQQQMVAVRARLDQLRSRRELRRRSNQLETDPFAPLEGSKRRAAVTSASTVSNSTSPAETRTDHAPASSLAVPPGAPSPSAAGFGNNPTIPTTPAISVQLRDTLDPATLALMRKTEQTSGAPSDDIQAMQVALTALAARAQHLDDQSKRLRAQARAR